MAELSAADLSAYTGGRLASGDTATATVLAAALAAARRYCGWSVSPVATVTVTLDGPGGYVLPLPTRNLLTVTAVSENGAALTVANLDVSRTKGTIEKHPRGRWTDRNSGISVTMSHGYTEAEAADWRRAVLRLADMMASDAAASGQRDSAELIRKKVDDVEYQWGESLIAADDRLSALLAQFRILPSP